MAQLKNPQKDFEIVKRVLGATEGTFRNNPYSGKFEDLRYTPTVSGGNSGLSFGLTQLDVAQNKDAKSLFEEYLMKALNQGWITDSEANDYYRRAQIKGLKEKSKKYHSKIDNFTSAEKNKIERSVFSPPEVRRKIDMADAKRIQFVVDETTALIKAVRKAWGTAGVFEPSVDYDHRKAIGHVVSWINRTGKPNQMTNFMIGNPEDVYVGTKPLQIHAPPTLGDVEDYLMHSKEFAAKASQNKSHKFNAVDKNIDLGIDEFRRVQGSNFTFGDPPPAHP